MSERLNNASCDDMSFTSCSPGIADLAVNLFYVHCNISIACEKQVLSELGLFSEDVDLDPLDASDGCQESAQEFQTC